VRPSHRSSPALERRAFGVGAEHRLQGLDHLALGDLGAGGFQQVRHQVLAGITGGPLQCAERGLGALAVALLTDGTDLQMATSQWTMGKAIDTFAPCGPALVTLDEIADVQDLAVRARINDETMQSGTTADMVFSVAEIVAHLSRVMTLVPGDIIATGTPAGVGMGRTPPVYLAAGDTVEVELGAVGILRNRVVSAT
jgi:hypothetical protein